MDKSLESVLSTITSNTDLMSKISEAVRSDTSSSSGLADVISLISPLFSESKDKTPTENEPSESHQASIVPQQAKDTIITSLSKSISKNSSLLIALKPYLSKERCQMIDSIIKISQLADIIKLV